MGGLATPRGGTLIPGQYGRRRREVAFVIASSIAAFCQPKSVRRALAGLITAILAATTLAVSEPSAAAAASGCPRISVIGARGSGEPASSGMGPEVSTFYTALQMELGKKLS